MSSLHRRLHGIFTGTSVRATSQTNTFKASARNARTKEGKLEQLVEKFKKSSASHRFRASHGVYESTVRRLASAQKFSMIEEILEAQKKYPDISTEGFAIRLISLYGKAGMFDHAHKVFEEMPELNCARTAKSFNALLAACVNAKKFDKVDELFRGLPQKVSIEVDLVSYNIVINAFCEMGSLDTALLMLDELEKNGLEPDSVTFNTLLNGFYNNGRFLDGEKIWCMMESKNVIPGIRSYNSRLRGMVHDNRISEAVNLFDEMRSKGIKPDVISYNALIKGFCNDGKLEEAKWWYRELRENECSPDWVTFVALIPLLCEEGDFDMALELCAEVINQRFTIDTVLVQRVVDGLVKEAKIEKAKELVELGKSKKFFHYKLKLPLDK
ncbi:small ribosomal subunit protein mS78 (rPPR3a)-like [Alnus glutinosa]|uniref:small ribosomal subunit protein mS78 (rPPR3a)-like n=1 Tax=Alnus glutinosa TaxID=3517 RepID=UPI002D76FA79|nr:small ribosomal subunit protein mS78 (rPPR3a)-like [Alnus glutinosa]